MNYDSQKIEIAKQFANLHEATVAVWVPAKDDLSEDEHYLAIFENLAMGVYGDCYGINAEYNDEGDLIREATEFEVDVDRFELKDEHRDLFFFELTCELTGAGKFIEEHGRHGNW